MTVHYTEFSKIGKANIVANGNIDGTGEIQAAKSVTASGALATTETSAEFEDNTRLVRVHATVDSYIKFGGSDVDASVAPRIFLGAGTFDYFAAEPGQYLNVVDA